MSEAQKGSQPAVKRSRKEVLFGVIQQLDLDDSQKNILKERWADQTVWYGSKASQAKKRRNVLRIILIVCGALLPAAPILEDFQVKLGPNEMSVSLVITTLLGLTVAATAALESFFDYQEIYNRNRETAELLKMEGWSFMSLSGTYKYYRTHKSAFERFCTRVEDIIKRDIAAFVEAQDQKREKKEEE